MSQAWSQWQGQIIDGKFQLQQQLGTSGESASFSALLQPASGTRDGGPEKVAIRLIADCSNPELQLSRWRMIQGLSHPNLLRLLDTGRCRLGDIDLIYAVMEYAEENLAQIIPERALTADEARQMLDPALDVLVYLHDKGLIHGHLKPANIMAMNDQVKLASDGICPADDQSATAADVWSLGVTLAEVLTQHLPVFEENAADPLLPQGLPVEFVEIVRGCLRQDLRLRWTIPAIRERLHAVVVKPGTPVLQPSTPQPPPAPVEAAPTFAEALRPKPVASQRPAPLARAAAAAPSGRTEMAASPALSPSKESSPTTGPQAPDRGEFARGGVAVPAPATFAQQEDVKVVPIQDSTKRGLVVPSASQPIKIYSTFAMRSRALLATAIAQVQPFVRRTISQTGVAAQRLGSLTSRASLFVAAQVEQSLRRLPAQTMRGTALFVLVVFTGAIALYFALSLFHRKPVSESARAKTPAPAVIIAKPPQRSSPKKHSPGKPSPSKTQPQAQMIPQVPEPRASSQPISGTQTQAAPQAPAAQNVALRSQTQEGVRRIDDGGAEDDAANQPPATKSSRSAARASNAGANVDSIHEVLPQVSQSALHTIHGTVRVSVRVKLDPAGNVARAELANAGPSKYFARKSLEAAQNWKFTSSAGAPFLVHFEFTHSGTHAFATRVGS